MEHMDMFMLYLFPSPSGRDAQRLTLYPRGEIEREHPLKASEHRVFSHWEYTGRLFTPDLPSSDTLPIRDFRLFVNDSPVETVFQPQNGSFYIQTVFGSRLFKECYGYVRLTVRFFFQDTFHTLDTDFIPVMVQKGPMNDSVRRMSEYVYYHNEGVLFATAPPHSRSRRFQHMGRNTIEARLSLLKQIAAVYETNYAYFKVNSRFQMETKEEVDKFEKLQYISAGTIDYISCHPEELERTNSITAIPYGRFRYQPERTQMTNSVRTFDIYENRAIFGFLKKLTTQIGEMRQIVDCMIASGTDNRYPYTSNGCIESSYFVFARTVSLLHSTQSDLIALQKLYEALLSAYSGIYSSVRPCPVIQLPRPTAIFLAVSPYRQVYDSMVAWFQLGADSLSEAKYIFSFLKISSLYETYILTKLLNYCKDRGYQLETVRRVIYPLPPLAYYENTKCNNLFIFHRENTKISVYYQPVIYTSDRSETTGIGLYRKTSIPFPRDLSDDIPSGNYYAPDYLIKIEEDQTDTANYVIIDAKFSKTQNVKKFQVAALAYKYLFSLAPLRTSDAILGLYIINGQTEDGEDGHIDVYDRSLTPGEILPHVEILTMTEYTSGNEAIHTRLFHETIGRYL